MMQGSNSVENLLFLSYWPNEHRAALTRLLFASGDALEENITIQTRCSWRAIGESGPVYLRISGAGDPGVMNKKTLPLGRI